MIATRPGEYCCGVFEIGNFNYVRDRGPNGAPHYHRIGSSWSTQSKAEQTSLDELRSIVAPLVNRCGAIICTTGADQEYMDDHLLACGFVPSVFKNKVHEKGDVKFWFLDTSKYKDGEP